MVQHEIETLATLESQDELEPELPVTEGRPPGVYDTESAAPRCSRHGHSRYSPLALSTYTSSPFLDRIIDLLGLSGTARPQLSDRSPNKKSTHDLTPNQKRETVEQVSDDKEDEGSQVKQRLGNVYRACVVAFIRTTLDSVIRCGLVQHTQPVDMDMSGPSGPSHPQQRNIRGGPWLVRPTWIIPAGTTLHNKDKAAFECSSLTEAGVTATDIEQWFTLQGLDVSIWNPGRIDPVAFLELEQQQQPQRSEILYPFLDVQVPSVVRAFFSQDPQSQFDPTLLEQVQQEKLRVLKYGVEGRGQGKREHMEEKSPIPHTHT